MNAIELLKDQHDEVEALFKKYGKAEGIAEKRKLFEMIADRLAAHATIEEKIFYPVAYKNGEDDLEELLEEAVEEHLAAKRTIADLLEMAPSDAQFDAKMTVLKEQIEHHIEEEEGELFPKAKKEIEKVLLEEMGAEMKEEFEALMTGEPRNDVPGETEEAAPLQ